MATLGYSVTRGNTDHMHQAEVSIRPQFYDVDPMQVVWHGNYPRYFEDARVALLDRIDFGYARMREMGYACPVVDMRIKYIEPIRYGQGIAVSAFLTEYENRLKIDYLIRDSETGKILTKAHTIQVAVRLDTGAMEMAMPAAFLNNLRNKG